MRKVTKEEFYAKVNPLDVVLRSERTETIWELRNRTVIGRTTPGYVCTGPREYFLAA